MHPTEILSAEHRVIELVLGAVDAMAACAFDRGQIDIDAARQAVDFLQTFADRGHHGKEEARLFPAMESAGLPHDAGPTAVMRYEHDLGRAEVRRMAVALAEYAEGKGGAADAFAFAGRTFVDILREHIDKEDQVLFPMADRMLDEATQARLLTDFAQVDRADLGEGAHERYVAIAQALAGQYHVVLGPKPVHAHGCGHGGRG